MRPATTRLALSRALKQQCPSRHLHSSPIALATVSPIHGTGPPPAPPKPAADSADARLERRKRQAELLEKAQLARDSAAPSSQRKTAAKPTTPLSRRRFWKHVHVRDVDGGLEVHLDNRPLRRPDTKEIIRLPPSKPMLAAALALEWDLLASVQQASRHHLIPLTSLVCRALDIADDDAKSESSSQTIDPKTEGGVAAGSSSSSGSLRAGVAKMLLRYLDTDSLLCWAPPPKYGQDAPDAGGRSLRDLQREAAEETVSYLTTRVWPGVEIEPVLDGESIVPRRHRPETRQVIEGWIMGLSPWELAGLERGVLAGKGLLGAVRLLVEWSEGFVGLRSIDGGGDAGQGGKFDVEKAARLASIEVDWQTGNWGEVEDTHDVQKEDLRRQLGSLVLLVSGTGKQ